MNFMVQSHKGGVGKTVTAIHLAGCLSEKYGGDNVGLVDYDPNKSSLMWSVEGKLPYTVVADDEELGNEELVVYDSQGRLQSTALERVAIYSDLMILVTTPRKGSVEAMERLIEDVVSTGAEGNYKVLITIVPWWNPRRARGLRDEFVEAQIPVFDTMIPAREAVEDAWESGCLVRDVRRRNGKDVWDAYRKVVDEIEEMFGEGEGGVEGG